MDASAAITEPGVVAGVSRHAVWMAGLSRGFVFAPLGRMEQDRNAGTAHLTGRLVDPTDANKVFDIDISFSGLTNLVPASSPMLGLLPVAYAINGGPVDPSTWYYYTMFSGTLTGANDYRGAVLQVSPRGPAPQFGTGANNRNTLYGFSGWFVYTVDQQPLTGNPIAAGTGDFNIDLQSDCMCAEDSAPDAAFTNNLGTGALATLGSFGCGTQWDLAHTAIFAADSSSGTAIVTGELVAQGNPNCSFDFQLAFQGRVDPGDPGYPPNGSPSIGHILPGGLVNNGGPIDPSIWVFYTAVNGTFLGKGSLAGAKVTVTGKTGAPVTQVGPGAARNTQVGVHATLSLRVDQQPQSGPFLPNTDGGLWLELAMCGRPVFMPLGINAPPSLPTVTDKCFTLSGCDLDTVTQVTFAGKTITSQDPCDFGVGYFEIVDASTLKLCPPLCLDPAVLPVVAKDSSGTASDPLPLAIVEPNAPALAVAPTLHVGCVQNMWVWGGPGPEDLGYCIFISGSPLPSVLPGIVTLGLGNQFTNFFGMDGHFPNCFSMLIGTVPVEAIGITLYFQAIPMSLSGFTLPFTTTNVGSTTYTL